jgi:hypothetical protein
MTLLLCCLVPGWVVVPHLGHDGVEAVVAPLGLAAVPLDRRRHQIEDLRFGMARPLLGVRPVVDGSLFNCLVEDEPTPAPGPLSTIWLRNDDRGSWSRDVPDTMRSTGAQPATGELSARVVEPPADRDAAAPADRVYARLTSADGLSWRRDDRCEGGVRW